MRLLVGFSAVAVIGLGPLMVWWAVQRARRRPDLRWKPTGYRYLHTGHDQVLAQSGAMRAAETATKRRAVASERSKPLTRRRSASPVAMPSVATPQPVMNIVDMRRRQVAK